MANTQGIGYQWKLECLTSAGGNLNSTAIKAALYLASATTGPSNASYTATGEVSGTNYTAGGASVTNGTAALDGAVAHWTPGAAISWTTVTLSTSFDAVMIYDDTHASDRNIGVFTFGATTVTAGNFTINMPTDDGTTGLVRLN